MLKHIYSTLHLPPSTTKSMSMNCIYAEYGMSIVEYSTYFLTYFYI